MTTMPGALAAGVERAVDARVTAARRLGGGDINDAWSVRLDDGRDVFVKANDDAPPDMFEAEAHGLGWLAAAGALRLPGVVAIAERFLVLELIEPARAVADHDVKLGRGLAAMHRAGAAGFGLDRDNYIGRLPQCNTPCDDWAEFYRTRRLAPQLERAIDAGLADAGLRRDFDRLWAVLPDRVGPAEPPARLHGDLWAGNRHIDEAGLPVLIDPAAHAGHREVDLAMMRLFGGFGPAVFDSYAEAYPLAPGWQERVPLYQLYFLMVHVNLFGSGYLGSVRAALSNLVR